MKPYQYSRINQLRFSEEEIEERKNWKCPKHRHNGISHASCFNKAHNIKERIGSFDIEAGALNADFDLTLAWCIKTIGKDEYWYDHIIKEDLEEGIYDARIMESLIESLWSYDRIVTHYGKALWFDVPFIRARYLWLKARGFYKGVDFPTYGMLWISDTYSMSKRCLKISSRRQNNVANVVQGKDIKTKIEKDFWMAIKYGSPQERSKAIKYIKEHNIKDCDQLEGNYLALLPFCREVRTSI